MLAIRWYPRFTSSGLEYKTWATLTYRTRFKRIYARFAENLAYARPANPIDTASCSLTPVPPQKTATLAYANINTAAARCRTPPGAPHACLVVAAFAIAISGSSCRHHAAPRPMTVGRRFLAEHGVDIRHQRHAPDGDSASRKINRKKIVRKAAEFALDEFKIDLK